VLVDHGVDRISAEELTVPPGMDELFSLLALHDAHADPRWDAVIVDCAPTSETLRMLSFPDMARWWLEKVFPAEQQILDAAGPLARALLDIELPGHAAFADVHRLSRRLIAMNGLLRDRRHCTIRLVMTPDRMVIGEAMRTFTYLNLYGYLTDAVIVNRVFPADVGAYFAAWRDVQEEHLALVSSAFAPVPVLTAAYLDREVLGAEMLDRLAADLFDGRDAGAVMYDELTQEFELGEEGARLQVKLPFAAKEEVTVKKVGQELVVRVQGAKRTIALPSALAPLRPRGARLRDDTLEVTFHAATN
jgi:arsenite-transporting ATPase